MTVFAAVLTIYAPCFAGEEPVGEPAASPQPAVVASAAVALPAAVPVSQPVPESAASPKSAPVRASADAQAAPAIPPARADAGADLVLSPGDVDSQVARVREAEESAEAGGEFFANAAEEVEKGDNGTHAGLTTRIDKFVRYFQNKGRGKFETWLARSGRYSDMMRGILGKYGLPGDLIYLALIESGFSPKAYSVASASGPWQFISGTARRYGLRVDWWTDERRDYEKSTHAAASYLKDLYGMFDSWPLAAAAYNAGEGKIQRAVARYKTDDYAQLIRHRYLAQETKDYVPKMLAAISIAKEPEKYGFGDVRYEDPIAFDKVVVPGGTDLAAMGRVIGLPADTMKEWNPELRRFCTPPNRPAYDIRLPKGYGPIAAERMDEIASEAKVTFLLHAVRKGETLASLAEKYGTSPAALKEMNGLKRAAVGRSARLVIPVIGLSEEEAIPGREVSAGQLEMAHMRVEEGARRGRGRSVAARTIRIRKGDTLEKIARSAGVPVAELAKANGIEPGGTIKTGARLKLPGRASSRTAAKGGKHKVRKGDTLGKIARPNGIDAGDRNGIRPGQALPRGRVPVIPTES